MSDPTLAVPRVTASRAAAARRAREIAEAKRLRRLTAALAGGAALAGLAVANLLRARQAERRHPPRGSFAFVEGVRLHFRQWGAGGPPVILIHGNGTESSDWETSGLVRSLRGFRVIALDRPGYGHSERPRRTLWTAAAQADLVAGLLDTLGIEEPAVVVGHSWGTLVANALALRHPERVRGMVQLGGYFRPSARADVWLFSPPAVPVLGDLLRYTVSPVVGRALAPRLIAKMFAPRPVPERFRQGFPLDLALRPLTIRASAEESAMMVPTAAWLGRSLHRIEAPVEVIAGSQDEIVTSERQSAAYARALPNGRYTELRGLGHMIHYFAQDRIAAAVRHLARARQPQSRPAAARQREHAAAM